MGPLIDTSVFVSAERDELHSAWSLAQLANGADAVVSPVILSELRVGVISASNQGAIAMRRKGTLDTALRLLCLPLTEATAELHAQIMVSLRGGGSIRIRTHDVWLAATALEHGITLVTCNRRDFADIRGLKFIAPE